MLIQTENFGYVDHFRCRFHEERYDYPLHMHQFAEIVIVLDGEIELLTEDRRERASKGDIAFIDSFQIHGFHTPSKCTVWICVFSATYASDYYQVYQGQRGNRMVFTPTKPLFSYITDHLIQQEQYDNMHIRAGICTILEQYRLSVSMQPHEQNGSTLSALFQYMNTHFKEPLTLNSVSKAIGYSSGYISHLLGNIPSLNFNVLLSTLRIEYAKHRLVTTDASVLEIALECGFATERSFYRSFRQLVGVTPLKYRNAATDKT